jgi:hypothetical protein
MLTSCDGVDILADFKEPANDVNLGIWKNNYTLISHFTMVQLPATPLCMLAHRGQKYHL